MVGTSSRVREAAAAMPPTEPFHLGGFLHQWYGKARHDLTPSHSRSLAMADLLALATPEERARWDGVQLDYASPRGASALRTLIAARYHGLGEDDVVCCAGAQESMACVARALLAEGDHAIVVIPLYQPLAWAVTDRVHATGVPMEDTLDIRRVAAAIRPQTRMVLINTPNSPTGATVDVATQADLVELCRQHGLWLVNDEVYRESVADPALLPPPIAVAYERGVSIGALSKAFGLPGLRVGWVASQDTALLAQVATAKSALSSCLAAPAEVLAQVALREEARLIGAARTLGAANRVALDAWLARHPTLFEPDPARSLAFAFPSYRGAEGADAFAARLVATTGTLVLPSGLWRTPLGPVPGGRLRISLGQPDVAAGLAATDDFLASLE